MKSSGQCWDRLGEVRPHDVLSQYRVIDHPWHDRWYKKPRLSDDRG